MPSAPAQAATSCWGYVSRIGRAIRPSGRRPVDLGPATLILAIAVYAAMYFAIGDELVVGSNWFALLSLWFAALVAGEIASWVKFPRAPAMVLAGLALAQIPNSATLRLPGPWVGVIRSLALAVALLRGGLELEFHTIWRLKVPASAYTFIPMLGVVLGLAGIAMALVGMPLMLGISFGFIMNAVSPGIIVAQMLSLASNGYGITHDVSIIAMLASILDEVGNLTGFAIFNNIALPSGEASLAWTILKGPTEVVIGAVGGVVLGVVCGCSRIWNTDAKRCTAVLVSVGLLMVVLADERIEMMTGGAIGALVIGLVAPVCWEHGWPGFLSQGRHEHYAEAVEHVTAILWSWVFEPLLFGTIAYDVVFSSINNQTVALAIGFIFIGQAIRFLLAGGVMLALKFTWKEALFFAVTWLPKGTVQAALGSVPLNLARSAESLGDQHEQYLEWGHLIKASAALSVAIFAALGTMGIEKLAPVLLPREKTPTELMEEELEILEQQVPELNQKSFNGNAAAAAAVAANNKDANYESPFAGASSDDAADGFGMSHHSSDQQQQPAAAAAAAAAVAAGSGFAGQQQSRNLIARASRDNITLRRMNTLQKLSKRYSLNRAPTARRGSHYQVPSACAEGGGFEERREDGGFVAEGAQVTELHELQQMPAGATGMGGGGSAHPSAFHTTADTHLAELVIQHPRLLKEYMMAVQELVELMTLTDNEVLANAGLGYGIQLSHKIQALQSTLAAPTAITSRQMMRQFNDLKELQALRHQMTFNHHSPQATAHAAAAAAVAAADLETAMTPSSSGSLRQNQGKQSTSRTTSLPTRF